MRRQTLDTLTLRARRSLVRVRQVDEDAPQLRPYLSGLVARAHTVTAHTHVAHSVTLLAVPGTQAHCTTSSTVSHTLALAGLHRQF